MKKWTRVLGITLLSLGTMSFLSGGFNLSIESEEASFYIALLFITIGTMMEIMEWLQNKKLKISKS